MEKTILTRPEITLMGIKIRTNNTSEKNPESAQIGSTVQRYFQEEISKKIIHRKNPGTILCVYTEYESDFHGDYTFFMGEEITNMVTPTDSLAVHMIEAQTYARFTTPAGPMPQVVIQAWQAIWQMSEAELGGRRRYISDFEVYDHRAADPKNAVVDIYIGIT